MNLSKSILVLFLLLVVGCAATQQSPPLPAGALVWSSERRLIWDDFQGTAVQTGGAIACEIAIQSPATFMGGNIFSKSVAVGDCYVDRKHSWADKMKVNNQLLLYNQTLFDIYELYTRKLRQRFDNTSFGLGDQSDSFTRIFEENHQDLLDELNVFRTASKLGADSAVVNNWSSRIGNRIDSLSQYAKKLH